MGAKKYQPPAPPPKKSLFGGFGDPSFISTDPEKDRSDPYIKSEPIPSRFLGSNMKVGRTPKGRTPDCFLGKEFSTMASASQAGKNGPDQYQDPGKEDLARRKAAKAKNISDKEFKMASVPKKPSGTGSNFGTFGGQIEHKPEYKVVPRGEPSALAENRPKQQPPNIKTAPGKKGTYGFINTTIGKAPEAPKVNDEYDAVRKRDRELWEESKKKRIGTGVFRATVPAKQTFDEKGPGVSAVYDHYEMKPVKEKKQPPTKEGKSEEEKKAWKSAGPPKPFLNQFPNVRIEGKEEPYDTLRLKRKEEKEKGPKPLAGTWKPVSGSKSAVCKSLLKRYY